MKNVHLILTDKPSRLHLGDSGLVLCDLNFGKNTINGQNIYITNDSEIKEGDKSLLFVDGFEPMILTHFKPVEKGYKGKKIILTTNDLLIKDGVQAIDDEFLEWFCSKNGKVDFVEIIEIENEKNK
jgi:hypothetical protein